MVALFVNIRKQDKRKHMHQSYLNKVIAMKPLQQIHCKAKYASVSSYTAKNIKHLFAAFFRTPLQCCSRVSFCIELILHRLYIGKIILHLTKTWQLLYFLLFCLFLSVIFGHFLVG